MNTRPDRHDPEGEAPVPGLDQLVRERLPERDLWAGIEARLPPRKRRTAPWTYALAASICVATIAGLLLRSPDAPDSAAAVQVASLESGAGTVSDDSTGTVWDPANQHLAERLPRPVRTLRAESWDGLPDDMGVPDSGLVSVGYRPSSRFAARPVRTGGHQRTLMRANLKLIAQAERELRRALREDPESESLRDLLSAAEAQRDALQGLISTEHD